MKTRWEVLDRLDDLGEAMVTGNVWLERDIIQSVLVANETSLQLRQIERLGGSYRDLVSRQIVEAETSRELVGARKEALNELRKAVLNRSIIDRWLNTPWRSTAIAATVTTVALISFDLSF